MISVIIGVFNAEKTLKRAITSLKSSHPLEIIAVNDASTDNSLKILNSLKENYPYITVLSNTENCGLSYCLNLALMHSKYPYIARMDADDICYENRLDAQIDFLINNPDFSFVGSGAKLFDENGIYGLRIYPEFPNLQDYIKGNPYLHPSLMFKKSVLLNIDGYNESRKFLRCEDYELMFRLLAAKEKGCNLPVPLLYYYENRKQTKHSFKTRLNEYGVRKKGYKIINAPFFKRINKLKPLILAFTPRFIYNSLHQKTYFKIDEKLPD